MVIIFTGPIGSGKTTKLENWVNGRSDTGGILMPVRSGGRYFQQIRSGEEYPAEADMGDDNVIVIGKYRFSADAFIRANSEIMKGFGKYNNIVIDEIGPLELQGKGFAPSLFNIVNNKRRMSQTDIFLVIREGLVKDIVEYFKITDFEVIFSLTDFD